MNYIELLKTSAEISGNCACMGLDPCIEMLPIKKENPEQCITSFFEELFSSMKNKNLCPAAFKPNIGYYSALDKPLDGEFYGSKALASVIKMIREKFKGIPIILDSKRGDISRSSFNYAIEAFDCWHADAVTVSPYMGTDSIMPFVEKSYKVKGAYILNRTSNSGGKDFQNLKITDSLNNGNSHLYIAVAKKISEYAKSGFCTGAVTGATGIEELKNIACFYAGEKPVPLLIPGVGSQGGSASEVLSILKDANYDLSIVRINSSGGLTHPWKSSVIPENYLEICIENIEKLLQQTSLSGH